MVWDIQKLDEMFADAADWNQRSLEVGTEIIYVRFVDGLTTSGQISEYVIKPAMKMQGSTMAQLYRNALYGNVVNAVAKPCKDLQDAAYFLVNGFCVLLFPEVGAIAFETKTGEKRSLSGPELEHTSKGAKDAFVETNRTNTSLVRRHLRTPDLRLFETKVGRRSLTNVSVLWIDGLTNMDYVDKLKRRLAQIDIDGLLTPSAVEEYITGSRRTAFPLLQYTERTDRFCNGLLQGRVGLFVDGIPLGYLLPVDIGYLMNSPEDYSRDYLSASWVRILRYGALILGLLLPAVYIAMVTYHGQYIPDALRGIIQKGREGVPFSPIWEVLGLLIAFELLQESGIHLPQSIGQSVSIIGGIVVGTVGVEAGLISSTALICVSLAGVCGFVLPNRDLAGAVRIWRFALSGLASILGLGGVGIGIVILVLHLLSLKSLGVPYCIPFEPGIIRKRLVRDKLRSEKLHPIDKKKQK